MSLLAGLLVTGSLAPFNYWVLQPVSIILLYFSVSDGSIARTVFRFYLFNLAMFGAGVSWIYVSINEYGGASPFLAALLVALFVISYSLIALPQGFLCQVPAHKRASGSICLCGTVDVTGVVSILVPDRVPLVVYRLQFSCNAALGIRTIVGCVWRFIYCGVDKRVSVQADHTTTDVIVSPPGYPVNRRGIFYQYGIHATLIHSTCIACAGKCRPAHQVGPGKC